MKRILIITMFYLLAGCAPDEILIDVTPAPSKLVISSLIIPDDIMLVTVTRSFSALAGNDKENLEEDLVNNLLVAKAEISLSYVNQSVFLEPFLDNPGLYIGQFEPEVNREYTLSVFDVETNERISATTLMLPRIELDSVSLTEEIVNGDTILTTYYAFTDPPGDNWYAINAYHTDPTNQQINFSLLEQFVFHTDLFSDQTKEDAEIENEIKIVNPGNTSGVALMLVNISEGYFRFLDARERASGVIASLTSEPINHPTNVEGGFGYFNVHNPDIKVVKRPN